MTIGARLLASGPGWRVVDVVCTAGPQDRPFEERHESVCMALVTDGTFQYRTEQGRAVMMPGSVLLGNVGAAFECGHEHGHGDRCLAFQFSPEFLEPVLADRCGVRSMAFCEPRVPPLPALMPIIAASQAARDGQGSGVELEELALTLAGTIHEVLDGDGASRAPSSRDEQRVTAALRQIEAAPYESFALQRLAQQAATSSYHFLRVFRQVVGVTPGQYVLHSRLRQAAVRLRKTDEAISAIAFDCGFGDLSTFNRHFRRVAGVAPSAYRAKRLS